MGKSEFSERRPLSARIVFWQSGESSDSSRGMKRALIFLSFALLASPAAAVPGGEIDTLEIGRYTCELPGDALGPRGEHVPDADFAIVFGSSYRAKGIRGTYLLTGDQIVFTSGPRKGERYRQQTVHFLRRLNPDGSDSELRCVMANRTNTFDF